LLRWRAIVRIRYTRVTDSDSFAATQGWVFRVVRGTCTASASGAAVGIQGLILWSMYDVLARYGDAVRRTRATDESSTSSTVMSSVEKGKSVTAYRACRKLVVRLPSRNDNLIRHVCLDIVQTKHRNTENQNKTGYQEVETKVAVGWPDMDKS